jgi:hypothetical protein
LIDCDQLVNKIGIRFALTDWFQAQEDQLKEIRVETVKALPAGRKGLTQVRCHLLWVVIGVTPLLSKCAKWRSLF